MVLAGEVTVTEKVIGCPNAGGVPGGGFTVCTTAVGWRRL
jgi:hypothetical protein